MHQRNHTAARDSETESKFYLPVGVSPSPETTLLERLQTVLFGRRV